MHISALRDVQLIERGFESYFYSVQNLETAKYFSFWKSCLAVQRGRANFAVAAAKRPLSSTVRRGTILKITALGTKPPRPNPGRGVISISRETSGHGGDRGLQRVCRAASGVRDSVTSWVEKSVLWDLIHG